MNLPVSPPALFERLAGVADVFIVTPNRRLARALGRQFDAWQAARGLRVWETPRVLPFAAFAAHLYDGAQHDPSSTGVRAPLAPAQEQALWDTVIDASDVPLASPGAAAQLAAEAWLLAHQWRIVDRLRHFALTEDTRVFVDWAREYEARVERIGAIDQARLPDAVAKLAGDGRLALPAEVVLAGFDEPTPQQRALTDALAARGTRVGWHEAVGTPGECRRLVAADVRDELGRMADWVADRLAGDANARIGIVVPDLGRMRGSIARALDMALAPDALLARPDRPRPYTISLGASLADQPVVASALSVLRIAAGPVESEEASALLRSPHVDLGPASACAGFDVEWRRRAGRTCSLDHLLGVARTPRNERHAAPRAALEALHAWRQRVGSRRRRLSEWAALLTEALRAVGFPGSEPPDSTEYQAVMRWRELIAELASLDRVGEAVDLRAAVGRLIRLARSTVFQPEGGEPPVQVLGLLEANGLEFDHLWLVGMTADAWPPAARPHPLLPLELQRAHRMPGALVELELQRATRSLNRLVRAAPEVIASHALRDGEATLTASPAIGDWPQLAPPAPARRAADAIGVVPLESVVDARASALPAGRAVGGGASIVTDQSACPFRAFARHRLSAEEPEIPHDGLAPSERGEAVHRLLARFWLAMPARTRTFVASQAPATRTAALERAAEQALARLRERRLDSLGDRLLAIEKRRLVNLASAWLDYELGARAEFEVAAVEDARALPVGPLSLNGRLDRVDRLADGTTVVIDYKTGGIGGVSAWLGARPDEPQLPLYLVASEPQARGIAFARLRAGTAEYVALADDERLLPNASVPVREGFADWAALLDAWRVELGRLADAFAAGVAPVDPKKPDACRYCGFAPLCRFDERAGEALPADAGLAEPGGFTDE
jgi:probable DNA repair protein